MEQPKAIFQDEINTPSGRKIENKHVIKHMQRKNFRFNSSNRTKCIDSNVKDNNLQHHIVVDNY